MEDKNETELTLDEKRVIAVGKMCDRFGEGCFTLREILFAICYIAETGYRDIQP